MNYHDYRQLACLFLLELNQPTRGALERDARFSSALSVNLQDARVEFTRLFTWSVYPYASVFLDDAATLNGDSTAYVERFYEHAGFELPREWMLAAPDALGAELECVGWLAEKGDEMRAREFLSECVLPWAPVCCIALERNAKLELYRTLAQVTRNLLLDEGEGLDAFSVPRDERKEPEPDERDLQWVVGHMLAPQRCGIFLSKNDLTEIAGRVKVPAGFGDRGLMLANLLRGAGSQERVTETLEALQNNVREWSTSYAGWVLQYPRSAARWRMWLARAEATDAMLTEMQRAAGRFDVEKA